MRADVDVVSAISSKNQFQPYQRFTKESERSHITLKEMLSSSLMLSFFLLQLIVISIQGFHQKQEILSFEQFVEIFPEYSHCRKSELINLNENLKKVKEAECLERQARFNLHLREVRDHNALNTTWKAGQKNYRAILSIYCTTTVHI